MIKALFQEGNTTNTELIFLATPNGPRQANLVQWVKRNLQTENQIPGPSEWLGMRS